MPSSNRNLTQSVLCLRDSPDGHVRKSGEQSDPDLRFTLPLPGRQGLGSRCPLHILGWFRSDLCLPSSSHSSQNSALDQVLPRHDGDSHSLPTPVSTLASTFTTAQSTSSYSVTGSSRSAKMQMFTTCTHFRHWVAETIRLTYENSSESELPKIKAHDVRAVAASIAYCHSLPTPVWTLASTSTTAQSTSSYSVTGSRTIPVRPQHMQASIPSRPQTVESGHVAIIRECLRQHQFPESVVEMAADPLGDSSSHVYNAQ